MYKELLEDYLKKLCFFLKSGLCVIPLAPAKEMWS